jgi:RNA polymerase sigma-70 factor (ECF subfamily)
MAIPKETVPASLMEHSELADAIARARAGDPEAWGQVYRQYAEAIFRFCRRALPTREDAEDATMEIFVKVREKLGQYDSQRPFGAWLYKVAANHCWDTLRRRRVRQDRETADVDELPIASADPGQLAQVVEQQTSAEVRAALDDLPPRARVVLVLRYYADMSYEEIAAVLHLDPERIGVVLLRARQQLRAALTGRRESGAASGGNA